MRILAVFLVIAAAWAGAWYFMNQEGVKTETVEAVYANADSDLIKIESPEPGDKVERTFTVSGEARGNWYFEASFPLEVVDQSGTVLFVGPVSADGEWMTTEFVPFSEDITVPGTYTGPATLVLRKDNPSGEAQFDASVSIPIVIE